MEMTVDKETSRKVVKVTGYVLVQLLLITVARLRKVEMDLGDLGLALEEEQEEIDSYSNDIDDCHEHIEDIDEFVRELETGNVTAVSDVPSVLTEMREERADHQNLLRVLGDARFTHEQQLSQLQSQLEELKKERIILRKAHLGIFCLFNRNGVFVLERIREKLTATDLPVA